MGRAINLTVIGAECNTGESCSHPGFAAFTFSQISLEKTKIFLHPQTIPATKQGRLESRALGGNRSKRRNLLKRG